VLYIGFLYLCLTGLRLELRSTIMLALGLFTLQYLIAAYNPKIVGYSGFLLFAFIIGRFVGILHPPSEDETPLTPARKILGWMALVIFILCLSPNPIDLTMFAGPPPQ